MAPLRKVVSKKVEFSKARGCNMVRMTLECGHPLNRLASKKNECQRVRCTTCEMQEDTNA